MGVFLYNVSIPQNGNVICGKMMIDQWNVGVIWCHYRGSPFSEPNLPGKIALTPTSTQRLQSPASVTLGGFGQLSPCWLRWLLWDMLGFYGILGDVCIWYGLHDLLLSFDMSPILHDLVGWPCKLGPYAHGPCGSKGLFWFYLEEQLWPEQFLMMWAVGCCVQFGSVTHTYWMCVELLM